MRNGLRLLTATTALTLLTAATASGFEYGDPVPIVTGSTPDVRAATSGPGHGLALHLWDTDRDEDFSTVRFQDADGRWHQFAPTGGSQRVALAQLEGGAELAAWEAKGTLYVRTWSRDGTLAPEQPLLAGVRGWKLSADRAGTVAIAAALADGSLVATVRDPGGAFSAPQRVGTGTAFSLSPIGADGTVSVRSGAQQMVRLGRAPQFAVMIADPPAGAGLWQADDSRSVHVGHSVLRLCPKDRCNAPKLFAWGKRELIAFRRPSGRHFEPARWYIARRQPDGRFGKPELATLDFSTMPVWTPGGLAFTRASSGDVARRMRGLYLIPFSGTSKRAPRLYLSQVGPSMTRASVYVFCRTACAIDGTINAKRVTMDGGRRLLSPLEQANVWVSERPSVKRFRLALTARDVHGRTTRLVKTVERPRIEIIPPPPHDGATAPGSGGRRGSRASRASG